MTFEFPDPSVLDERTVSSNLVRLSGLVPMGLVGVRPVKHQETGRILMLGGLFALERDLLLVDRRTGRSVETTNDGDNVVGFFD